MWQCECGEFNNEESTYCVQCNKLRVVKVKAKPPARPAPTNTETIFRRIQDFILLDIAVTALLVVYCFWRASQPVQIRAAESGEVLTMPGVAFESVVPLLLAVILQMWLLVYLLRAFYRVALSSERNAVFLQKIYQSLEGTEEEEKAEESAAQSLIKPPTSGGEKERRKK